MPLTDTAIKALKQRAKRYSVTDGNGLTLEVFPAGGMLWHFRYRLNGKAERVTLGRYPDLSLKNARVKRAEAAVVVAMGQSPARQKQLSKTGNSGAVSVADFGNRFFKEIVARDRKDATIPRRYFTKSILPAIGTKPMRDVTTEDVRSIVWAKKEQGFDAAAGAVRGVLKRMFDYGVTCGVVSTNPVAGLPMRHVHRARSRDRVLSPDELRVFLRATLESNIRRQFRIGFLLILSTLARKSELLLARWEHVDLGAAEWHVPADHSKTGRPHVVYLSRQTVELFRELKSLSSGSELVMPSRSSLSRPFAQNAMNQALKVALVGTSIPAFTIHDLRRTASTLLHENGWPSDVVEKALNHTIGGVRGVYNRAEYAAQRRDMLQFWSDHIDELVGTGQVVLGRFRSAA